MRKASRDMGRRNARSAAPGCTRCAVDMVSKRARRARQRERVRVDNRCMEPELTANRLRELLSYDPKTGVFVWRVWQNSRAKAGQIAGSKSDYLRISVDYVDYLAQRLAWLYMTGEWPKGVIDHKDGNRFNNAWDNLRDTNTSINNRNRRTANSNSGTGILGVSYSQERQKFVAQIKYGGKNRMLGRYETIEQAEAAYKEAKTRHHSEAVGLSIKAS